jgi:hypothetical protein
MRLTMAERRVVIKAFAERYQRGSRSERGEVLDEVVVASGYTRSYASWLLRWHGKKVWVGSRVRLIGDIGVRHRRRRTRTYGEEVVRVVKRIWVMADYPAGKRLVVIIRSWVPILERCGELDLRAEVRRTLMTISAATIDRVLRPERKRMALRSRARTKPGSLLKHQVPIRTFAEWDDARPGFVEIDLVGHDGGNARGEFAYTLDVTDVASGWTEPIAVRNRAQVWVFDAIEEARRRLPFELVGIDSDNGGEFINRHLIRYCEQQGITFTRSRPYRKNDNCFVEEKNWSVVRRFAGYARCDTDAELRCLNELWSVVRRYGNYFLPSMKLVEKVRSGSRVTKKYDAPTTPYERLLASPHLNEDRKAALRATFETLNPAELGRQIRTLQKRLARLQARKNLEPAWAVDRAAGVESPPTGFLHPLGKRSASPTPPTAPTTTTHTSPSFHMDSQ